MADNSGSDLLVLAGGGAGTFALAFLSALLAKKKGKEDAADGPVATVQGAIVDSRAARELGEALVDLKRTINGSDQDRRGENRDLTDWLRRLIDALERNTDSNRLDLLPPTLQKQLGQIDQSDKRSK